MTTYQHRWRSDQRSLCLFIPHFSAQVIAAYHPRLQQRPFVVLRQDPFSHKSTVWSCSPRAGQMGVKPGTPIMEVRKKLPRLMTVPRNHRFEATLIEDLKGILQQFTPDFQFREGGVIIADISHLAAAPPKETEQKARLLKTEIRRKTGLTTLSLGIAASSTIAWILARVAEPGGIRTCRPGEESAALRFLDCRLLPSLSRSCRERLKKYGIIKIGQLQQLERQDLICRLGREGEQIYCMIRGVDFYSRSKKVPPLFTQTTFKKDIIHQKAIVRRVLHTADRLAFQLQVKGLLAEKVTFLLRYTDGRTGQRTAPLPVPTDDFFTLARTCRALFSAAYQRRVAIQSVRLIIQTPLSGPGPAPLFETGQEKRQRLLQAGITRIRQRFHFNAIFQGEQLECCRVRPGRKPETEKLPPDRDTSRQHVPPLPPGIWVGIASQTRGSIQGKNLPAGPRHSFSFQEIVHTRHHPSLPSDVKAIAARARGPCRFTVRVHHKVLIPSSLDIPAGQKILKQQMSAAAPLLEEGCFYSFLILVPPSIIRSQRILDYLLKVTALPLRHRFDVHLQFAHPSWYIPYIPDTLRAHGIGICNHHAETLLATTGKGYIRCASRNHGSPPAGKEADHWIRRQLEFKEKVDQLAVVYLGNSPRDTASRALCNIRLLHRYRQNLTNQAE